MDVEKLSPLFPETRPNPQSSFLVFPSTSRRLASLWILGWLALLGSAGSLKAAQTLTLFWNANTESGLAGYRLYHGTNSCNGRANCQYAYSVFVPAPGTNCTVSNLIFAQGVTNYFSVTAVSTDGVESAPSDEIAYSGVRSGISLVLTESVVAAPPATGVPPHLQDTEEIVLAGRTPTGGNEPGVGIDLSVAGPRLEIVPFGNPAMAFWVRFDAPANKSCELQVSEDLQSWSVLAPFTTGASNQRMEFVDLPSSENRRFYRLAIQ